MDITLNLLYSQLITPSITFLMGVLTGWTLKSLVSSVDLRSDMNIIMQITIFILWALSVIKGLTDSSYNVPIEIHAFMGLVIGVLNDKTGKFIIQLWNKK